MFTNTGLVEYVKSKLDAKTYYVYGGFGRKITKDLLKRAIAMYGKFYTEARIADAYKHLGYQAFDCVGIIKGYLWDDGKK